MTIEERTYHIMGTTSILGSSPANPAVRSAYLASKAKDPTGLSEEESAYLPDEEQKGITVFLQDDEDASCMYLDYQIRGFFKSALNALEYDNKIKQAKSKVDKFLFIAPRKIHIFQGWQAGLRHRRRLRTESSRGHDAGAAYDGSGQRAD